jgi:acylphosphatase
LEQTSTVTVVRRRVVVSGWVQGVFFRDSARRRAEARGVAGLARNRGDGRVELEFEGEPAAVADMVAWAHHGPARAEVTAVEVEELAPTGSRGFVVF